MQLLEEISCFDFYSLTTSHMVTHICTWILFGLEQTATWSQIHLARSIDRARSAPVVLCYVLYKSAYIRNNTKFVYVDTNLDS